MIGSELVAQLTRGGDEVVRLARKENQLTGDLDAVIHLAGEPIAGRWTTEKKRRIRESRVEGTQRLCAALPRSVKVLVCASAIGIYGDRGTEPLTEDSEPGSGFLPEICLAWEKAAMMPGIRVVKLRFGVVLNAKGGALAKMLLPFRLGLGGIVGSGRQFWSWVALDDAVGAIMHAIRSEELRGPVNVVSPNPVTNREFTKTLGKVLGRPTALPMPAMAARLVFGEMADALLLCSARVQPIRLEGDLYRFRFSELEPALRHLL